MDRQGPLSGIRVLDIGHALAGPFAATLLGDFGADVIKIERPGSGDAMRQLGPENEDGGVWWKSIARNKRCIGLDWKHSEARPVLKRLVQTANVLVENFRPGVLERNELGPDVLLDWNPDLIVLRISGYGQTGPYSERAGFGKAAEALSGLLHLTGFPDGPPVYAGFPLGDMTTGLMGAYGIVMALYAQKTGAARGQVIDLPIYETPMRLVDYHIPLRTGSDSIPVRNGNRQPLGIALAGTFKSADGKWIIYSAATFSVAKRVLRLVGGEAFENDTRFGTMQSTCSCDEEIGIKVGEWMATRNADEILRQFSAAEAVAELVYDTDAILADPHILARGNIAAVRGERTKVVNVVPSMGATPGAVQWLGRSKVGSDTFSVLSDLVGLSSDQIQKLLNCGAVAASREG